MCATSFVIILSFSDFLILAIRDLTNRRFGNLTVVRSMWGDNGLLNWHCRCDCSSRLNVEPAALVSGRVTHCGCMTKQREPLADAAADQATRRANIIACNWLLELLQKEKAPEGAGSCSLNQEADGKSAHKASDEAIPGRNYHGNNYTRLPHTRQQ